MFPKYLQNLPSITELTLHESAANKKTQYVLDIFVKFIIQIQFKRNEFSKAG